MRCVNMWKRYRFYTKSVNDYRPLVCNPSYPWWCSGSGIDGEEEYAVIVAYLPINENLYRYWDDAYEVDYTHEERIVFTDRFPKPDYYKG